MLSIVVALSLYPAFFYSELHSELVPSNRPEWYFGWAYGVGWGAAIFLIGAILLLACDKETEEIYYREKTIQINHNNHHQVHHPGNNHVQVQGVNHHQQGIHHGINHHQHQYHDNLMKA